MNTFMYYASSLLLFSFLSNLDTCYSIVKCEYSIVIDRNRTKSECTGDFCVSKTGFFSNGDSNTITGCVSGLDAVRLGCFKESFDTGSCICNDTDFCNSNATKKTYAPSPEVECYSGSVVDGKLVGNNRCKGRVCLLSSTPVDDGKFQLFASCGDADEEQRQPDNNVGCLYFSNIERFSSAASWKCRCQTKLCNLHSIKTPKASNKVKCLMNMPTPSEQSTSNATCTGDLCMLAPIDRSTNLYRRGCVSFSNGAEMNPKVVKVELLSGDSEMHFCNEDNCNKDTEHSLTSIAKFHGKTII